MKTKRSKVKRLITTMLLASSVFMAALPAQAASSQFIDMYGPNVYSVESRYHSGDTVFYLVNHFSNQYSGDIYWRLVDLYGNELDSGVVTSANDYYQNQITLTGNNGNAAKLIMECPNGWCAGDGYIETQ